MTVLSFGALKDILVEIDQIPKKGGGGRYVLPIHRYISKCIYVRLCVSRFVDQIEGLWTWVNLCPRGYR